MELTRLIKMANEIGGFFGQFPDRGEAASSIAAHIKNFWEPRMRREIIGYARTDGKELNDIVRTAILSLELPP